MKIFTCTVILFVFLSGCLHSKKSTVTTDPLASDRSVILQFHPFWGGMSSCELERKNTKDKLSYTCIVRRPMGGDSTYSSFVTISKAKADSIFLQAEKAEWNSDLFYGSATGAIGLTVFGEFKKGMQKKNLNCEKLNDARELPKEFLKLASLLNALAPEEMKLY